MNTDELLAAGDPYPERSVEGLALEAESHALMEEIMSAPTKAPTREVSRLRRRPHWVAPVVAAAAVAAVVAGAVFLIGPQSDESSPAANSPAAPRDANANQTPAEEPPPTAANLRYVVLSAAGWNVTDAYDDDSGGYLAWSNGESTLEVTWYEAEEHGTYLRDRKQGGYRTKRASLLGQTGWAFRTRYVDSGGNQWWATDNGPKHRNRTQGSGTKQSGREVLQVETMLPPVGDWFLSFNAEVSNEAEYQELVASLQRVDRRTWLAAMNGSVIQPRDAESFLDEVGRDVPMPPGVTVTPDDLRLPRDPYQARAAFVTPVMCGWAEEYAAGGESALKVLRDSADWPVMRALATGGELASTFRSEVKRLAGHPDYNGWRGLWGC